MLKCHHAECRMFCRENSTSGPLVWGVRIIRVRSLGTWCPIQNNSKKILWSGKEFNEHCEDEVII